MARRGGWRFVLLLFLVPRCSCNGCNQDYGCNFDFGGGGGCGDFGDSNCPDVVPAGTHTIATQSGFGTCKLECESGWSDCDDNATNGCETAGACPKPLEAGPPQPKVLTVLDAEPRGLAACGSFVYYFDGDALDVIDAVSDAVSPVLTSDGTPSGGLACDSNNVYWATRDEADGAVPNGTVWALGLGDLVPTAVAEGVDPGRGIDTRAGDRVYWLARSGFGDAGSMLAYSTFDAGSFAVMPAAETSAYKAFAMGSDGDYALANGTLWFAALGPDAGGPVVIPIDASAGSALVAADNATYAIVHGDYVFPSDAGDDASDASDAADDADADDATGDDASDAAAPDADDAGPEADASDASAPPVDTILRVGPTPAKLLSGLHVVVAAAGGSGIVAATDDTVYFISLPNAFVSTLGTSMLHVTDVALDGGYAYWTTAGEGTVAGAVWKAAHP
ncbi:MAG TPA: hypothetical protein VGH28_00190 [Polyangiaceae bacterium]|jgi:hypothetical protein